MSAASTTRPTSADSGRHASRTRAASPSEVVSRSAGTATASPARTAAIGEQRDQHRDRGVRQHPDVACGRDGSPPRPARAADGLGGRAGPVLPLRDRADDRRTGGDLGLTADDGARHERAARADPGAGADLDPADVQHVAVQPVAARGRPRARPSSRCRGSACPVTGGIECRSTLLAHLGPQRPGRTSASTPPRRGWRRRARRPAARPARAAGGCDRRVGTRPGVTRRSRIRAPSADSAIRPGAATRASQPSSDPPPRERRQVVQPEDEPAEVAAGHHPGEPTQAGEHAQRDGEDDLADLGLRRGRADVAVRCAPRGRSSRRAWRQRSDRRVLVEVRDGHLRDSVLGAARPSGPRSGCHHRGRRSRRSRR